VVELEVDVVGTVELVSMGIVEAALEVIIIGELVIDEILLLLLLRVEMVVDCEAVELELKLELVSPLGETFDVVEPVADVVGLVVDNVVDVVTVLVAIVDVAG
jgi:hypothetical protein